MTRWKYESINLVSIFIASIYLSLGLSVISPTKLDANDSAAEVAAGGIQLRKEARISMEKERLTISLDMVTVEYEFLNTTDQDITTEVAFPTPPYDYGFDSYYGVYKLSDFRVWVDGHEVKYQVEAKAKFKGADYTDYLQGLGIEIHTFGQLDPLRLPIPEGYWKHSQIEKLSTGAKDELIRVGLLDKEYDAPTWTVFRTYHWNQLFPARKILRIRHEYGPVIGFEPFQLEVTKSEVPHPCIDTSLEEKLRKEQHKYYQLGHNDEAQFNQMAWVKYILTTANNWLTPIKTFELVVQDAAPDQFHKPISTTVCWDGMVERVDTTKWFSRRLNYVPSSELAVYYLRKFTLPE